MENQPIITVKNISKKYKINHHQGGYVALRDVLTNVFKNPLSFLKDKTKNILGIDTKEEFWALKDINFEVMRGEVVGIIGRNGAGKSTLLKILSQITPPTTGEIKIHGTVGSLLEVGTGFHPELTGRENIFLNGAILGMKKKNIVEKFNEIVEFAGIEKFIDTPVKYYSSGMYVRLAFSVAAYMDPDILIVDEVLAVGDAEFQKKCLGKMKDITTKEGRTILFVSHNMEAIQSLCKKCILLNNGKVESIGETSTILGIYNKKNNSIMEANTPVEFTNKSTNKELIFQKIWITDNNNQIKNTIKHDEDFNIHLEFDVVKEIGPIEITLTIKNSRGINITSTSLSDSMNGKVYNFKNGNYSTNTKIKGNLLIPDTYTVRIYAHEKGIRDIEIKEDSIGIQILDNNSTVLSYGDSSLLWNCVFSNAQWDVNTK